MEKKYTLQIDMKNTGEDWYFDIRQPDGQNLSVNDTASFLVTAVSICVRNSENPKELIISLVDQMNNELSKIHIDE